MHNLFYSRGRSMSIVFRHRGGDVSIIVLVHGRGSNFTYKIKGQGEWES